MMVNDYMLDKVLGNNTKIFVGTDDKLPDYVTLTLFSMGLFWTAHEWEGAKKKTLLKICHTDFTMMILGATVSHLKKIQRYMNHSTHPLSSSGISIFTPEISKFCSIKKYRYRQHFGTNY